jgi:hypothetical protein
LYPGLPRAKHIAERLGLKWSDVLEVAYSHSDEQNMLLDRKRRGSHAKWITSESAASSLAVVARRLNKDTLSLDEYRRERRKMLAEDAKRWKHGRQLRLPTEQQVIDVLGSWPEAQRAASLKAGDRKGGWRRKRWVRRDCVAAVARYLADEGRHAVSTGYEDWRSKQQDIFPPLAAISSRYGWDDIEDDARNLLLEQELGIKRRP